MHRRHALTLLAAGALLPGRLRAEESAMPIDIRGDLIGHFTDNGTSGTFVAYDAGRARLIASDASRSRTEMRPASTFKVPNSIIALETGVVADPDGDVFKWDGVKREIESWNRDHTLRTAIAASVVPVYQEIARRIGSERMTSFIQAFGYGNGDTGGGIDRFWLTGNLRISPLAQIRFIDRLRTGTLPVSQRSQKLVRDILPVIDTGTAVIRAKTGLAGAEADRPMLGWLVGWAEKGDRQTPFALNMDIRDPQQAGLRGTVARLCLGAIGAI